MDVDKLLADKQDNIICINNLRDEYEMVSNQYFNGSIGADATRIIQNKLMSMINSYERKIISIDKKLVKYGIAA